MKFKTLAIAVIIIVLTSCLSSSDEDYMDISSENEEEQNNDLSSVIQTHFGDAIDFNDLENYENQSRNRVFFHLH